MNRITSFEVDHTKLNPGIYLSRKDGDYCTFDLRVKKPNAGDYMDNVTMHTVEHMMATFLRNSSRADSVLYFGPMGCRTGFYFIAHESIDSKSVVSLIKDCLQKTIDYEGEVFGASEIECGNYRELDLDSAKKCCKEYLDVLKDIYFVQKYSE